MFRFQLAEHLHLTVGQVMRMPVSEYIGWQAYLKLKADVRR